MLAMNDEDFEKIASEWESNGISLKDALDERYDYYTLFISSNTIVNAVCNHLKDIIDAYVRRKPGDFICADYFVVSVHIPIIMELILCDMRTWARGRGLYPSREARGGQG